MNTDRQPNNGLIIIVAALIGPKKAFPRLSRPDTSFTERVRYHPNTAHSPRCAPDGLTGDVRTAQKRAREKAWGSQGS